MILAASATISDANDESIVKTLVLYVTTKKMMQRIS